MDAKLLDVEITNRIEQGLGIVVLELSSLHEQSLPEFSAGAHVDVHITPTITRQYSLCSPPGKTNYYRIAVLNEPQSRGGSEIIYKEFIVGKKISISKPRNQFALHNNAYNTLLIAGGIGITPLLAMAYALKNEKKAFALHYCLRNRNTGAFVPELDEQFDGKIFYHYDDEAETQHLSPSKLFKQYDANTHIYVCGPSGFMEWVMSVAKAANYPEQQIHFEYFNADVDVSGSAFEVHCSKSNVTVMVRDNQTIVQALYQAGIKVDVSCEQGICGTCITDVLEGEPAHRDQFLTDEEKAENDQMALCCSRANSQRLVIDI